MKGSLARVSRLFKHQSKDGVRTRRMARVRITNPLSVCQNSGLGQNPRLEEQPLAIGTCTVLAEIELHCGPTIIPVNLTFEKSHTQASLPSTSHQHPNQCKAAAPPQLSSPPCLLKALAAMQKEPNVVRNVLR